MKLVSKESLKINKVEIDIINEDKTPEVLEEMFSVKDMEKKISDVFEKISDKLVDQIFDKIIKDEVLIEKFTASLLKKINIKIEKV